MRSLLILLCCLASLNLFAYSTANVPIDDPVYRDVDQLVAAGLVSDVIYGQRPWSRREIARIIGESLEKTSCAMSHASCKTDSPYINRILSRLKRDYQAELVGLGYVEGEKNQVRLEALGSVRFDYTLLDSPFRAIPQNNDLGTINAQINPLVSGREGRHYLDGNTLGLETTHRAELGRFFSLYGRPRLELLVPNTGNTEVNPTAQQVYGKFAYRNLEIEAGRDALIWGQGENGGLMFSNNTRPLDMIKLTSSAPFYHPWIFRYLGPSKYTFFVANLGPEREFPHAFIYGIEASIRPVHFLELGLAHSIIMGGEGAPNTKWTDPMTEFFFFRRGGIHGDLFQVADHRFGFNWRFKIPPLRNTEWYLETLWNDLGRQTVHANFTEQMGFVSGLYFPRLTEDGTTDLRIEMSHLPPMIYRHEVWVTGQVLNDRLLGSEAGPDSDTVSITSRSEIRRDTLWTTTIAYENRDSDRYTQTISPRGGPDRVVKATDNPTEHRWRLESGIRWPLDQAVQMRVGGGYERVRNFSFSSDENIDNFLGEFLMIFLL